MATEKHLVAAVGLTREAALAADRAVIAIAGGGDSRRLSDSLDAALRAGASGIVSFGIAGGAAPFLYPGAIVVATGIVMPDGSRIMTDPAWRASLKARLAGAFELDLYGSDLAVGEAHRKSELHRVTGAAAIDMELHVAAEVAARHKAPFAAIRVVADTARQSLPPAALLGMRPDGGVDLEAVLRSIAGMPGQLPDLMRTAWDAGLALRSLRSVRTLLGPGFGLLDLVTLAAEAADGALPAPTDLLGVGPAGLHA